MFRKHTRLFMLCGLVLLLLSTWAFSLAHAEPGKRQLTQNVSVVDLGGASYVIISVTDAPATQADTP